MYVARLFAPSIRYRYPSPSLAESLRNIKKYHSNATMSLNLENDGLVGLRNDNLDCDGLAMVVDDNCEFNFEGKSYRSCTDYVQAKQCRTAGIFIDLACLLQG
jgi:hypothetical protein